MAKQSGWMTKNKYGSFAPVREKNSCKIFLKPEDYFHNFMGYLEEAEECIMIHDWLISPEFQLKSSVIPVPILRFDFILTQKAKQGVKVYLITYDESSHYKTTNTLVPLHPSITVIKASKKFYAYHEKFAVIDYNMTFLDHKYVLQCQALRTANEWSLGLSNPENSIENANIHSIESSKASFDLTNSSRSFVWSEMGAMIQKPYAEAIIKRVVKAHLQNHKWRARIFIPQKIEIQKNISKNTVPRRYVFVLDGENSVFGKLRNLGIDPQSYILLIDSTTNALEKGLLKSMQTYHDHSKILEVDDKKTVIETATTCQPLIAGSFASDIAFFAF
ncbi:hypothetical protein ACO0QE_003697 [Hanseniaspora vineae]